ncbi:hypothetical protein [Bacillus sp. JJ1773]|uniref:hypothetical protein n=1 Tax=Bacillus sp. JJ1773 TaxID=3122965 RepID=UPI002FFD6C7D
MNPSNAVIPLTLLKDEIPDIYSIRIGSNHVRIIVSIGYHRQYSRGMEILHNFLSNRARLWKNEVSFHTSITLKQSNGLFRKLI